MAKKGQVVQLQVEINTEEEWLKLLQRDGLIIVDVYSDWCGPCSGMSNMLKKIKLEIGGDLLHLAMAKADNIESLARFRNKSEPTWMFIANGKLVNFMFGANSPKLTRMVIDEFNKEKLAREGKRIRTYTEIDELTDEERERIEVIENETRAVKERDMAKACKELHDRRTAEAHQILDNLNHLGVILIFPHVKTRYVEAFGDLFNDAGLTITSTEKPTITEAQLSEMFYFLDDECPFTDEGVEELLENQCVLLLIKPKPAGTCDDTTDNLLQQIVYGAMRAAPGSPKSPAQLLSKYIRVIEEGEVEEEVTAQGVWLPETDLVKATMLRLFFQRLSDHFTIPEPEPTPPHYAMAFEAWRRHELAGLMNKYQKEVLRYGFFDSEHSEEAKLIAKTVHAYEKGGQKERGPNERMILQLSKKRSECVLAFIQMKPTYVSPNVKEGERECRIFFEDDYDDIASEDEEGEFEELPDAPPLDELEEAGEGEGEAAPPAPKPAPPAAADGEALPEGELPEGVEMVPAPGFDPTAPPPEMEEFGPPPPPPMEAPPAEEATPPPAEEAPAPPAEEAAE